VKKFLNHVKKHMFRGLIAVIPVTLCFFVVRFLYVFVDQRIAGYFDDYLRFHIPGLGIAIVIGILYGVGVVTSNILGKQLLGLFEGITSKIPLINTTYRIGKQLTETLSLPEKQVFKKAVLVDYLKPGMWTVGFITGTIIDERNKNEKLFKVFVPTPPNPTSGTMVVVREAETRDPGWTIEEALKTVISGGIIGPESIK